MFSVWWKHVLYSADEYKVSCFRQCDNLRLVSKTRKRNSASLTVDRIDTWRFFFLKFLHKCP